MRTLSVNVDLREEWELRAEVVSDELLDLLVCARLLGSELVAGEGENLEALTSEIGMHLHHLFIVLLSEASVRRDVDKKQAFLFFREVAKRLLISAYDV